MPLGSFGNRRQRQDIRLSLAQRATKSLARVSSRPFSGPMIASETRPIRAPLDRRKVRPRPVCVLGHVQCQSGEIHIGIARRRGNHASTGQRIGNHTPPWVAERIASGLEPKPSNQRCRAPRCGPSNRHYGGRSPLRHAVAPPRSPRMYERVIPTLV
jgi:hypothetical protein